MHEPPFQCRPHPRTTRSNHAAAAIVAASLTVLLACAGCGGSAGNGDEATGARAAPGETAAGLAAPDLSGLPPSNRAMAERLRELADGIHPVMYLYDNSTRAEGMYAEAQRLTDVRQRFELLFRSATELVRAGRTEEGLARLEEMLAWADSVDLPIHPTNLRHVREMRAMAMLRLGEQDNCLENHTIDSCLMPISGDGIHSIERGSRGAIAEYTTLLEEDPTSPTYRWLLNLAHMTLGEYPDGVPERYRIDPAVFESDHDLPRFPDRAAGAGVDAMGLAGGAIMEDFDGDGHLDLMASSWGLRDQLRLFMSRGDGSFEERTEAANLTGQLGGLNLTHADYDDDGDVDVLVLRGAWLFDLGQQPNSLLQNQGDGRSVDVPEASGILSLHPTQTASWADYDGDGDLDVFIGNEVSRSGPFPGELFRNEGDGAFTEVAAEVGLTVLGMVKAVTWGDFDDDGRPDLYVSRFGQPNLLFRNDGPDTSGRWRFTDVTAAAGVAEPVESFPAWWFDYDNDGRLDLFCASFTGFQGSKLDRIVRDFIGEPTDGSRCRLYRNRGDGTFEDVAPALGLDRVLPVMGANFGDLDGDGWLDMYLGTGEPRLTTLVPNVMLRNDAGRRFQDVTTAGGFGSIQKGHGVAFGDVDRDGDEDLYVTMGGAFSGDVYPNLLFENPGHGHRWITIRPVGVESNRFSVGARIEVVVSTPEGTRSIHRAVGTGGSFGSSTHQQEIGLAGAERIERLTVRWPTSGTTRTFEDVPLDSVIVVREDSDEIQVLEVEAVPLKTDGRGQNGHDGHGGHHGHGGHGDH